MEELKISHSNAKAKNNYMCPASTKLVRTEEAATNNNGTASKKMKTSPGDTVLMDEG
jgi:hypothetical protein